MEEKKETRQVEDDVGESIIALLVRLLEDQEGKKYEYRYVGEKKETA